MGDVGDELGLKALALHLLVHRPGKADGDVVQVLGIGPQVGGHPGGVHPIVQVPGGDGPAAPAQAGKAGRPPAQQHQGRPVDQDDQQPAAIAHGRRQNIGQQIDEKARDGPPGQGQLADQLPHAPIHCAPAPAEQAGPAQGARAQAHRQRAQQQRCTQHGPGEDGSSPCDHQVRLPLHLRPL